MPQKVPVSVDPELDARLSKFVGAVELCINHSASHALNRSAICRLGIVEMLDRYEQTPSDVARKLGFFVMAQK
jgi:butyrate kinase